ncbi:protease FtsH subunit HflC [Faunimonas pinastri]|uniref:Protein HflC n=1 Tax=Faunimonas pinastri TaxID=1855383 RepID=A0A1H9FNV1_9HYPH|nr:protease modulator HflC [Faunimonas pinastri]SEQ39028.1 protease FtsH subunit HflC [Faunimonas pinastri]
MRRFYAGLIGLLVLLFLAYSSLFVVYANQQALVLRWGEIRRVVDKPGLYFKVPTSLVETVSYVDKRLMSFDIDDLGVQVRDGRRYLVDAFLAFRISDPRKFRENMAGNLAQAQDNLRTQLNSALRSVYGQRSFEDALSAERQQMMVEVRDRIRPIAAGIGIDIVDVRIKRTDLLPEVSQQTFDRMKAERLAEAAQLRAMGTQRAAGIRAEADRKAVVAVADATRDADILRGQGDAERGRVLATAFAKDPDFFAFYRSLGAYRTALEGSNGTLVLSPDSEFFRYLKSPGGAPTPPAAGAAQ